MYNLIMEFTKALIKGKLIKRYKRFFADIKLDKEIVQHTVLILDL